MGQGGYVVSISIEHRIRQDLIGFPRPRIEVQSSAYIIPGSSIVDHSRSQASLTAKVPIEVDLYVMITGGYLYGPMLNAVYNRKVIDFDEADSVHVAIQQIGANETPAFNSGKLHISTRITEIGFIGSWCRACH